MTRRIQPALAAALAASAVASAPAVAQSIDAVPPGHAGRSHAPGAYVPPTQDLRGERARDAARAWFPPTQDLRGERARDAARSPADGGDDDVWGIIGIGLAGAGLVAGGATGVARHLRVRGSGRRVAV